MKLSMTTRDTTIGRHLVGVWIGGVWNGHFPDQNPKNNFQSPKFAGIFLPNFRLRNLKIQGPKDASPYHQPFHTPTRLPPRHESRFFVYHSEAYGFCWFCVPLLPPVSSLVLLALLFVFLLLSLSLQFSFFSFSLSLSSSLINISLSLSRSFLSWWCYYLDFFDFGSYTMDQIYFYKNFKAKNAQKIDNPEKNQSSSKVAKRRLRGLPQSDSKVTLIVTF